VERTIGWLMFHRRLARDYETLGESSEAMIQIAMVDMYGDQSDDLFASLPDLADFAGDRVQ
jgi:hypothetical protein